MKDIVQRLRDGPAPLGDPDLNDDAADEIDRLRWALTDVLKVATSWNLFNTTTIDNRTPSSTTLRLRAAEAVLRAKGRGLGRPR